MALEVDGDEVFGGGWSVVAEGPWAHLFKDSVHPGVSGARRLEMGSGPRKIVQVGSLVVTGNSQAYAVWALEDLVDDVEALKGTEVELVTEDGRTFQNVSLDAFAFTERVIVRKTGEAEWEIRRAYRAVWTQLVAND